MAVWRKASVAEARNVGTAQRGRIVGHVAVACDAVTGRAEAGVSGAPLLDRGVRDRALRARATTRQHDEQDSARRGCRSGVAEVTGSGRRRPPSADTEFAANAIPGCSTVARDARPWPGMLDRGLGRSTRGPGCSTVARDEDEDGGVKGSLSAQSGRPSRGCRPGLAGYPACRASSGRRGACSSSVSSSK